MAPSESMRGLGDLRGELNSCMPPQMESRGRCEVNDLRNESQLPEHPRRVHRKGRVTPSMVFALRLGEHAAK